MDDQVSDVEKHAVLGEAIVGIEAVTLDGRGQGARHLRGLGLQSLRGEHHLQTWNKYEM